MLSLLSSIGSSLSAIEKSQTLHTENLANVGTPGYIAKAGEYVDFPAGKSVNFVEQDKTIEARTSFVNMLTSNAKLNETTKTLENVNLGLQPLEDVSQQMKQSIGTPNAGDYLNTALNQFQMLYKNANETVAGSSQEQATLTSQANQLVDGYNQIKTTNQNSSQLSTYEYQHSVIAGLPLVKGNSGAKISGINNANAIINGGIAALTKDFDNFKNDINKIYGATVISGTSLNDAKVDQAVMATATPMQNPGFQDYSLNYEQYRATKVTTLTQQQSIDTTVLNESTNTFQTNYGVDQTKEAVAIQSNKNQYEALTKVFSVVDEMFQSLLKL